MYRYENQSQYDVIIGEAIIALLDENALITNAALLQKLQEFLLAESETWREAVIHRVIRNVTEAEAIVLLKSGNENEETAHRVLIPAKPTTRH